MKTMDPQVEGTNILELDEANKTALRKKKRRIWKSAVAIVVLCSMLALTTYALLLPSVTVEDNLFQMGVVDLELGNEEALFNTENASIEPGKTLVEEITLVNRSQVDLYYRLYLDQVQGGLEDQLIFRIYHGEQLLYQGTAGQLTLDNPCKDTTPLAAGETRTLTIQVYLPKQAGNDYQNQGLKFDIKVDGVQARNNPQQQFQ